MKNSLKYLLGFVVLFLFFSMFISCTSCSGVNNSNHVVDAGLVDAGVMPSASTTSEPLVPLPDQEVVKGDTWEISIPSGSDKTIDLQKDIVLSVTSQDLVSFILLLTKESYKNDYDSYLIYAIRSIRATGAEIEDTLPVLNKDQKYTLFKARKDEVSIFNWVTVKNGFAYTLSCGGSSEDEFLEETCTEMFNSLKLK